MNRYTSRTLLLEIVMIVVAVLFFFPLYVLVNLGLKRPSDASSPIAPVTHPTLSNLANAWSQAHLAGALLNSAIVTVVSVLLIVGLSALAAYPLARVTRNWSKITYLIFLIGLLLPFQLGLIPLYTTIRDLHLLGNLASLIIFYTGLQVPFATFLYVGFLRAIPGDYEEAAALDGASRLRAFLSVVFPLLRPITGTLIILNAIFVWNDFFTPLLYLSGSNNQTAPVALFSFVGQYTSQWNLVFAGLIITIAPILIIYFAMQRSIIRGFGGGLKG
jgi:raffinose/stachyose/melibiose transport system permease protein